jgi:hypothetical protein
MSRHAGALPRETFATAHVCRLATAWGEATLVAAHTVREPAANAGGARPLVEPHRWARAWTRLREVARAPANVARLRAFLAASGWGMPAGTSADEAVLERVAHLLAEGRVMWHERRADVDASWLRPEGGSASESALDEARKEELTWISIELIGENDEPIPSEPYRIELPDGTTRSGRLDAQGRARIDGLDPGSCRITFPDLDEAAWVPVT